MGFRSDDRAVSNLIGAIFVFGTIVILFAIYQAQVVPADNRATEFEHSNLVQNDMVELRNAILTAKTAGRTTFAEVQLGTTYPNRIFAVNPPPPAGTLRTGDPRPITVSASGSDPNLCPSDGTVQSRTLRFSPGYNEYRNGPDIVYENTVLYLDFGERQIPLTDEQLVQRGGDSVELVPLNTSLNEQGVNAVSVEPVPGNVRENELTDATIKLPTNLSESNWEDLLAGDLDPQNVTVSDGNLTLDTSGEVSVACSPMGLNEVPAGGERADDSLEINPAGPNDVNLVGISRTGDTVTIELNNTADRDTNLTESRVSFYFAGQTGGSSDPDPYDIAVDGTVVAQNRQVGEPLQQLDPEGELPGNGTVTNVDFRFNDLAGNPDSDFYVVKFRFLNGATGTYFIDVPS